MTNEKRASAPTDGGGIHPELITIGDPALRRPCARLDDLDEARRLCERLTRLLRQINGAGLAAPQIGVSARAFVVEVRRTEMFPDRPESPLLSVINPTLLSISSETDEDWEGCFRVPGYIGRVARATSLSLAYQDLEGVEQVQECSGYLARVIQHEYDHLEGMVYLQRMAGRDTLTTAQNFLRFHARHG